MSLVQRCNKPISSSPPTLWMGCCCDEDDGDILRHLMNSSTSSETLSPPQPTSTVISPMNSHFSALSSTDTLQIIFEKLPIPDLARASCVCRVWNSVASQRDMVTRAFLAPWKLKDVVGNPLSRSFWRDNSLAKFAISHRIMRGDSVASLAVKYSVQVCLISVRVYYQREMHNLCLIIFACVFSLKLIRIILQNHHWNWKL
jgi:hypothetical protein